jgi:N-acetyltransferase
MGFANQPTLSGETLHLRPLCADDKDALTAAASDPAIWAGHPVQDRYKPQVFGPYFDMLLASGGTLLIRERASGNTIGCSRYYPAPEGPDQIGIGFTFLRSEYWGGATNLELKSLMLGHAYKQVDRVWFHIGPTNIRSQKATAKLGARHMHTKQWAIGGSSTLWMCYALDKSDWHAHLKHLDQPDRSL